MSITPGQWNLTRLMVFCSLIAFLSLVGGAYAGPDQTSGTAEPVVYLNFNEGSGNNAFDLSGYGNAGSIQGASRADKTGCGHSLVFNGVDNFVRIPYTQKNHPEKAVSVSLWFYIDSYNPQVLVSTYNDGGYFLGFDDGNDLWWTVNLEGVGDVSLPVQHEGIALHQWHHVTATFDGKNSKVYLDGILRNQVNAPGTVHYQNKNYVMLGTGAGIYDSPDTGCPNFFRGGLDEVKIYDTALTQSQVLDDRFLCSQELVISAPDTKIEVPVSCIANPDAGMLVPGAPVIREMVFRNLSSQVIIPVKTPPGATLVVKVRDLYSRTYPDAWYVEIAGINGRINRGVAFPNTNNAPLSGVIADGNATVLVKYFDGPGRFPARVSVELGAVTPPPAPIIPQNISINNPIIVIYSASWATLIAIILVMVWLHRRRKSSK